MSIEIISSNSLQNLSVHFSEKIQKNITGVFDCPWVVTQTEGMNSWLRIRIAETQDIAAHIQFLSPADVLTKIYTTLTGRRYHLPDRNWINWIIFESLAEKTFVTSHPNVSSYYKENDVKRYALATKISDVFDQYQVYRPQIIKSWNQSYFNEPEEFRWQFDLWQIVRSKGGIGFVDKTEIGDKILEAIDSPEAIEKLSSRIPRIYFFGIAILTPFHLRVLHELGEHIHITFYLLNPAPEYYWLDTVSENSMQRIMQKNKKLHENDFTLGNDLLLTFGKIIKDSFWHLFQSDTFINAYVTPCNRFIDQPNTLLKKIQSDIFENAPLKQRNSLTEEDLTDGSVVIQSAYTPVREVEMLYNYLVNLAEARTTDLSPREILVMVSDIDKYAPYIRAVFNNAPYSFPYTIADESVSGTDTFYGAMQKLISLDEEQLTAESMLDLLENKSVQKRFGINQTEKIREVVRKSGIRFGTKGRNENETRFLSLEYGIKRIKYGICISGEPLYADGTDEFFPLDMVEGSDAQNIIRFCHFADQLLEYFRQRRQPRKLDDWLDFAQKIAEIFLANPDNTQDEEDLIRWQKFLDKQRAGATVMESILVFDVFKKGILDFIMHEKREHLFLRKGITFCSFIPMRSVPFRVVCMLGLNYDSFPRKEQPTRFSMIAQYPQRGDRNLKDNDKHLFLETILSAQEFLYLSFIGNSTKDNTTIPPSSILDLFVDYIVKKFPKKEQEANQKLVLNHPMHGFSKLYTSNSVYINYFNHDRFKKAAIFRVDEPRINPFQSSDTIALKSIQSFIKHPIRAYFQKVLQIFYQDEELLIPEQEMTAVNKLHEWTTIDTLLKDTDKSEEQFIQGMIKKGEWPLANEGKQSIDTISAQLSYMKKVYQDYTGSVVVGERDIIQQIGNDRISAKLTGIYEKKLIKFNNSSKLHANWLSGYLEFLLTIIDNQPLDYYFIQLNKNTHKLYMLPSANVSRESAKEKLAFIIQSFKQAHTAPFRFCPIFKNPIALVEKTADHFEKEIIKEITSDFGYLRFDNYLVKAMELGYFSKDHFEEFKTNTQIIFSDFNV